MEEMQEAGLEPTQNRQKPVTMPGCKKMRRLNQHCRIEWYRSMPKATASASAIESLAVTSTTNNPHNSGGWYQRNNFLKGERGFS